MWRHLKKKPFSFLTLSRGWNLILNFRKSVPLGNRFIWMSVCLSSLGHISNYKDKWFLVKRVVCGDFLVCKIPDNQKLKTISKNC
jgi:hypothetical protein